jgi:glycerol-3-phosphate cytidylyltransferase-like family protein
MRFTTVAFAASAIFAGLVVAPAAAQVVDGNGTANVVPRWIDTNTLGNSHISDTGTVIAATSTTGAQVVISGGIGMAGSRGLSAGGALGGGGASIQATGGSGVSCVIPGGTRCAVYRGGNGGSITLQPGGGGIGQTYNGFTYNGHVGVLLLAPSGGNVGIGFSAPSRTLEVKVGGTTLADDWTIRSSRRFKTNIQPLHDALGRIEALQGVSYVRTSDGKHEVGVVAEDVDRVVPEVVAHDPETHEVEGVDYSRLVALLIEAVKSQQVEIERLKSQMAQLTSNAAK